MKSICSLLIGFSLLLINAFGPGSKLSAQTLNDDGDTHLIEANGTNQYEGSAQEYTIPTTASNTISFTLRGGDGGFAKAGANCQSNGGQGALTEAVFKVGDGANELMYGGKIRFIVGKYGKGESTGGSSNATGGGGGGTAVLYRLPTDNNWIILAVAGGGGGAHQGNILGACIDSQKGPGGRSTESGGDGEGTNSGSGGTNGNGGTDGTDPIYDGFSGGGAYSNGNPNGGGQGYYQGGYGSQALNDGGFGFGGGGAATINGGGGGGGYSGGGGGGDHDNGGGGGSYVNSTYALSSTITAGTNGGGSSQNGYVEYTLSITPIVWTGAVNDNWNNSGNWSPARVPNSSDLVNINNAVNDPRIPSNVTANARVVRVFSGGELTISVYGELNLHPLQTNGIWNAGTIDNTGEIHISRYSSYPNYKGIENSGGTFINRLAAIVNINGTDDPGILNKNGGSFSNKFGGTINIGTAAGQIGDNGIRNEAGCFLTNFGNLNIRNTVNNGIDNYGSFSNGSNGTIKINQTTEDGIQCTGGTFTNNGGIEIGELATIGVDGIQLNSASSFKNNATGTLSIWEASNYGVRVDPNCTFENTGDLFIGGLGGSGIQGNAGIVVFGFFYNDPGGELFVDQTVFAGILTTNTGVFSNKDTMTIGSIAATGGDGIQNQSTFNNFSTGVIIIVETGQNGIRNVDETFANAGLIKIGEDGNIAHNAIYNAGDNPVFLNSSCSAAIHLFDKNILDPANSFTNSGTIVKESAGNSNIETNNGVIIYNAGSFTADNGDTPVSISGNISGIKLWTACDGNGWANAQNWYPGGAPVATDKVTIYPIGTTALIPTVKTGYAKYVYVEDGASLTNHGSLYVTDGDFRIEPGAIVGGNGQYDITGNFTVTSGTFNPGTSTVTMSGTANKGIGNDSITFYNLVIDKPSDIAVGIMSAVTVTNDLAINSGDLEVYGILSGSLTCPHLYLGSGSDLGNHGSVTLTGNDSGALWIQAGATARGNGQYFISGNFVVQGGTFIANASTVTMTGTAVGNTGISPDPVNFYNLVIDRASDKKVIIYPAVTVTNDLTINSGDLEVLATSTLACPHLYLGSGSDLYNEGHLSLTDGDLQIQSGATAQGNGHYSLVGNFALESGGAFTPDTSTVTMTGTGNHQIGNIPVNFYNVEIEKPSGNKITLINNVNVSNSLDFNSGILEVAGSASLTCPHLAVFSESQLLNYGHLTLTN